MAELEGRRYEGADPEEERKRRKIEGSFGLKGYDAPDDVWYASEKARLEEGEERKLLEGGFMTKLGKFQASWNVTDGGRAYSAEWVVPEGTEGEVILPGLPAGGKGEAVWNGQHRGHVEKGGMGMTARGGRHRVDVSCV